jgi:aminoglycoside 6'-N-acetyltransferase
MNQGQPGIPGEWYQLAIERKQEAGLIGDCAFHVFAHDTRQAEIGFSLARQYQGYGYATEAVMRLLEYLLGGLGLHRVTATCDAENHASAKLLERVGMRREGHLIENIWFKGAWGSEYLYALLHREWDMQWEATRQRIASGSRD